MSLLGVPLFIGSGSNRSPALHSAEALRMLLYLAMGGQEGVLGRLDFAVTQGDTPGQYVKIGAGGFAALARGPEQLYQMYGDLSAVAETVDTPASDSSGTRHHLVCIIVKDPNDGSGMWSVPDDPVNGPYVFFEVITDVPSGTRTLTELASSIGVRTGIPLARLDVPASTATVTNSMITDLRFVSNPATGLGPAPGGAGAEKLWTEADGITTISHLPPSQATDITFPAESSYQINVPEWATGADVFAFYNPQLDLGDAWGQATLALGTATATATIDMNPAGDYANNGGQRQVVMIAKTIAVPASMRGTTQTLQLRAHQFSDGQGNPALAPTGTLTANPGTNVYISVNFKEHPVFG